MAYINPEGYAALALYTGVIVEIVATSTPAVFKKVFIAAFRNVFGVKYIGCPLTGRKVRAGSVTGLVDLHCGMIQQGSIGSVLYIYPECIIKKAPREQRSSMRVLL